MKLPSLLSPETKAAFGGYSIRYCEHLEPGQLLHDKKEHVVYVRDRADAEALVATLNREVSRLLHEADEVFLAACGIDSSISE